MPRKKSSVPPNKRHNKQVQSAKGGVPKLVTVTGSSEMAEESGEVEPSKDESDESSSYLHKKFMRMKSREPQPETKLGEGTSKSKKSYICKYCKATFQKPSVLEKHIRAHTNERPYPCKRCGVAFKTKSNLYKHEKTRGHANHFNKSAQSSPDDNNNAETSNGSKTDSDSGEMSSNSSTVEKRIYKPKFARAIMDFSQNSGGSPNSLIAASPNKVPATSSSSNTGVSMSRPLVGSPSRAMGVSPSRTVGASPSRAVGASPSRTLGASPSKTLGASPSRTVGASPNRTVGVSPSRVMGVSPSRVMRMSPSNSLGVSPSRVMGASPSRGTLQENHPSGAADQENRMPNENVAMKFPLKPLEVSNLIHPTEPLRSYPTVGVEGDHSFRTISDNRIRAPITNEGLGVPDNSYESLARVYAPFPTWNTSFPPELHRSFSESNSSSPGLNTDINKTLEKQSRESLEKHISAIIKENEMIVKDKTGLARRKSHGGNSDASYSSESLQAEKVRPIMSPYYDNKMYPSSSIYKPVAWNDSPVASNKRSLSIEGEKDRCMKMPRLEEETRLPDYHLLEAKKLECYVPRSPPPPQPIILGTNLVPKPTYVFVCSCREQFPMLELLEVHQTVCSHSLMNHGCPPPVPVPDDQGIPLDLTKKAMEDENGLDLTVKKPSPINLTNRAHENVPPPPSTSHSSIVYNYPLIVESKSKTEPAVYDTKVKNESKIKSDAQCSYSPSKNNFLLKESCTPVEVYEKRNVNAKDAQEKYSSLTPKFSSLLHRSGGEVQVMDNLDRKAPKTEPMTLGLYDKDRSATYPFLLGHPSMEGAASVSPSVVATIAMSGLNSGGTVVQMQDSKPVMSPIRRAAISQGVIPVEGFGLPLVLGGKEHMSISLNPVPKIKDKPNPAPLLTNASTVIHPVAQLSYPHLLTTPLSPASSSFPVVMPPKSTVQLPKHYKPPFTEESLLKSVSSSSTGMSMIDPGTGRHIPVIPGIPGPYSTSNPVYSAGPLCTTISQSLSTTSLTTAELKSPVKEKTLLRVSGEPALKIPKKEKDFSSVMKNCGSSVVSSPLAKPAFTSVVLSTGSKEDVKREQASSLRIPLEIKVHPPPEGDEKLETKEEFNKNFLVPPKPKRPTDLPLKPGSFSIKGSPKGVPLVSPDTPRPHKSFSQVYLNGQCFTAINLKCSTKVQWCCLNCPQPMYGFHSGTNSMYSQWQTKVPKTESPIILEPAKAIALYDSRQKPSRYVVAKNSGVDPETVTSSPGRGRHHQREMDDSLERKSTGSQEDSEAGDLGPVRIRIFKGGFKTSESSMYVRGRGRGCYVCERCGIRCKKPSMLKKHIRTHTDVRPFRCRHCNFSFKTKGNLTKHMKSKAHYKTCMDSGIVPVPVTIDDSQIDECALQKQDALSGFVGGEGDESDGSDDEYDEEEDDDLSSTMADPCEASDADSSTGSLTSMNGSPSFGSRSYSNSTVDAGGKVAVLSAQSERETLINNTQMAFELRHQSSATHCFMVPTCGSAEGNRYYVPANRDLEVGTSKVSQRVTDFGKSIVTPKQMDVDSDRYSHGHVKPSGLEVPTIASILPLSFSTPPAPIVHSAQTPTTPLKEHPSEILSPVTENVTLLASLYNGVQMISTSTEKHRLSPEADENGPQASMYRVYLKERAFHGNQIKQQRQTTDKEEKHADRSTSVIRQSVVRTNAEGHITLPVSSMMLAPSQSPTVVTPLSNLAYLPPPPALLISSVPPASATRVANSVPVISHFSAPKPELPSSAALTRSIPEEIDLNLGKPDNRLGLDFRLRMSDNRMGVSDPRFKRPTDGLNEPDSRSRKPNDRLGSSDLELERPDNGVGAADSKFGRPEKLEVEMTEAGPGNLISRFETDTPILENADNKIRAVNSRIAEPDPRTKEKTDRVEGIDNRLESMDPRLSENDCKTKILLESEVAYSRSKISDPTPVVQSSRHNQNSAVLDSMPERDSAYRTSSSGSGSKSRNILSGSEAPSESAEKVRTGDRVADVAAVPVLERSEAQPLKSAPNPSSITEKSSRTETTVIASSKGGEHRIGGRSSTPSTMAKPKPGFPVGSNIRSENIKYSRVAEDSKCVCDVCQKTFSKQSQLRLHINIHYFERPFRCEACAISFRTKGHLQKHQRSLSHHNKVSMNMAFGTPTMENPRPFKCGDCKVAFRIHGHLAKHLRSKLHIMRLECLGKLPFGLYAEMERTGFNLNQIDTSDPENSLESLQLMAQKLIGKEAATVVSLPETVNWRERTISGSSEEFSDGVAYEETGEKCSSDAEIKEDGCATQQSHLKYEDISDSDS